MKIRRNYSPSMVSRRCKPPLPLNLRNRKVAALLNVNESVQLNLGYMQDEDLQKSSSRHALEFFRLRGRFHKELTHNYSDQNERARRSQLIQKNAVMFWARNFRIRVREGGSDCDFLFNGATDSFTGRRQTETAWKAYLYTAKFTQIQKSESA